MFEVKLNGHTPRTHCLDLCRGEVHHCAVLAVQGTGVTPGQMVEALEDAWWVTQYAQSSGLHSMDRLSQCLEFDGWLHMLRGLTGCPDGRGLAGCAYR